VAPSAAFSIVMAPPLSMSRSWSEFTVTAAPLVTLTVPPLPMRMSEGAPLFAVAVLIGVVRSLEMTT
jgi:hypothetical protein